MPWVSLYAFANWISLAKVPFGNLTYSYGKLPIYWWFSYSTGDSPYVKLPEVCVYHGLPYQPAEITDIPMIGSGFWDGSLKKQATS